MDFGKVAFDPGHYAGANAGPGTYREGDAMLIFSEALRKNYDVFCTRTNGMNIDLLERCKKAAGCDTLISLHTNAPEAASGIVIFYSVKHPEDKALAERLGSALAQATSLKFRGAKIRTFEKDAYTDYYGMIRYAVKQGIEHPFIVEHGSHWEFAIDTQKKIESCVKVYADVLGLKPLKPSVNDVVEHAYGKLLTDKKKWLEKANKDPEIYSLLLNYYNEKKGVK